MQVFAEVEDDQYDFHSYCLRKSTLRAYVKCVPFRLSLVGLTDTGDSLLRYADDVRSHPRYCSAAKGAIEVSFSHSSKLIQQLSKAQVYLRIHDDPTSVASPTLTNGVAQAVAEQKAVVEAKAAKEKAEKAVELVAKDKGKKRGFRLALPL